MREFLLGGALVELARAPGAESVLDAVIRASESTAIEGETVASGSDRAATMRVRNASGRPAILRFGPSTGVADQTASATILRQLEAAGVTSVPRVMSDGEVGGAAFVVETIVPGHRPPKVSDDLIARVAEFLAGLPKGDRPPASVREDIEAIAVAMPESAGDLLDLLERLRPHIEPLPSILSHRDLWSGNVLVDGSELGGVIDWDGGHLYGVPGTDLLHLFMSQRRERDRFDIGRVWVNKPWRSENFGRVTAQYWSALEIEPRSILMDAIAIAWWVGWLRQAITRHERLLADEPWLAANMSRVLKESLLLL
jgi:aminoglycoside phosphotransferase (APT) family kinase protein